MAMFLWFASLAMIAGCTLYGVRGVRRGVFIPHYKPETVGDVFRHEVRTIMEFGSEIADLFRPIIAEFLMNLGKFIYRKGFALYGVFSKHVFGRLDLDKGKTASFFLKQIREFKDELNREARDV